MKNYCIIIPSLKGIGGAQLYAFRRAKYLIKNGFNVFFYSIEYDKNYLEVDCDIKILFNEYLNQPFYSLTKKTSNEELEKFCKKFPNNNLIIESFCWISATWGEICANKTKAKHILYSLGEPILDQFRYKYALDFILFKYSRNELIGISDVSLSIILGRHFNPTNNNYVNIAFDINEVPKKTNSDFLEKIDFENKFVISTVSRLEKSYVKHLIEDVILFARKNKKLQVLLLICGDSLVNGLKSIDFIKNYRDRENPPQNLQLIFPGYVHPVGQDLFKKTSIFIGMGTAAVTSISQGCATVCIDPRVNKSIGIFGLETNNFAYTTNSNYFTIEQSITDLYTDKSKLTSAKKYGQKLFKSDFENNECMLKMDNYILNSSAKLEYYNFSKAGISFFFFKKLSLLTLYLSANIFLVSIYNKLFKNL